MYPCMPLFFTWLLREGCDVPIKVLVVVVMIVVEERKRYPLR